MKLTLLVVVGLSLLMNRSLRAAEPTTESVEKLFLVTKVEETVTAVRSQMDQRIKAMVGQMLQGKGDENGAREVADRLISRIVKDLQEELAWEKLKGAYVKLYRENFTQEEVDAQIAFYSTPVGRSVVEKAPVVSVKSSEITQARILPIFRRMQEYAQEEAAKQKE